MDSITSTIALWMNTYCACREDYNICFRYCQLCIQMWPQDLVLLNLISSPDPFFGQEKGFWWLLSFESAYWLEHACGLCLWIVTSLVSRLFLVRGKRKWALGRRPGCWPKSLEGAWERDYDIAYFQLFSSLGMRLGNFQWSGNETGKTCSSLGMRLGKLAVVWEWD